MGITDTDSPLPSIRTIHSYYSGYQEVDVNYVRLRGRTSAFQYLFLGGGYKPAGSPAELAWQHHIFRDWWQNYGQKYGLDPKPRARKIALVGN